MNNLGIPGTLDSREVAEMVGKNHGNLMRDINTYISYMEEGEIKIDSSDFFRPSQYMSDQNKEIPCYLVTKKGCEMIANKLTGAKGVQFTALYVQRFNSMEEGYAAIMSGENDKLLRAQAMERNSRTRQAALMLQMASDTRLCPEAIELLKVEAAQVCTGKTISYRPKLQEAKYYSATDIINEARLLYGVDISRNALGKLANRAGIKTDQYGMTVLRQGEHNKGQYPTFEYNADGKTRMLDLILATRT